MDLLLCGSHSCLLSKSFIDLFCNSSLIPGQQGQAYLLLLGPARQCNLRADDGPPDLIWLEELGTCCRGCHLSHIHRPTWNAGGDQGRYPSWFQIPCWIHSTNNDSFRTANTFTSMSTVLSSALQAIRSLSTTVSHLTPRTLPPPRISVWLSQVARNQLPHPTLYGRHMVATMEQSLQVPERRVLCLLTKLLVKVNGQRSRLPKNMGIHGLWECCQRMVVVI